MTRVAAVGVDVSLRLIFLGAVVLTVASCGSSKSVADSGPESVADSSPDVVAACQSLQNNFFAALPAAKSCSATNGGQCQKTVPLLSIGCSSPICLVAVNDDSALLPTGTQWTQLGCAQLLGYTCVQGCREARTGICASQDGGAVCDPTL
jgi:hypothetical protein